MCILKSRSMISFRAPGVYIQVQQSGGMERFFVFLPVTLLNARYTCYASLRLLYL